MLSPGPRPKAMSVVQALQDASQVAVLDHRQPWVVETRPGVRSALEPSLHPRSEFGSDFPPH